MNILKENAGILNYWYNTSSVTLQDISLEGNYLIYKDEKVDVSKFSFYEIINGNNLITDQLSTLSPEDFFKIIKLHCQFLESQELEQKKDDSQNKDSLEEIKKQNPVMQNVTIFESVKNSIKSQYFSVIDSSGMPHIFYNDRNVDVMALYNMVVSLHGINFTIDNLIQELGKRLYDVKLDSASDLINDSRTTEDFSNKMKSLNNQYKDDLSIRVFGNQEHDICFINNLNDLSNNRAITYERNDHGDLVAYTHAQNTSNEDIKNDGPESDEILKSETSKEELELIPYEEFIRLVSSNNAFTELEEEQVNLWYSTLGDIVLYEDFLDERVVSYFRKFSEYIQGIYVNQSNDSITINQAEAIKKYEEMIQTKDRGTIGNLDVLKYKAEEVNKLVLRNDYDKAGNVSVLQIIWVVVGIAIILTAVTMYVIN